VSGALRGNALAAFPEEAFSEDVVIRTSAVVDESLRLYPPAFVIVRQALHEDEAGGVPVPLVLIAPWIMHRHRRFW
jgi:cytochrome P450